MKLLMENWKKFLNEAKKETASVDEIEEVIFDVLKKEGGAAGLQPIEDALKELDKDLPEGFDLKAHIEEMPEEKIKFHDEGDVIEMTGLEEGELEENAFVLAADAARDAGEKEFEFPEGSGKMHNVTIKADIHTESKKK